MPAATEHHDALDPVRESADNYVLVLVLLVVYIGLGALISVWPWIVWVQGGLLIAATLVSLRSAHASRRLIGVIWFACAVFVVDAARGGQDLSWAGDLALAVIILAAPVSILRRVISHRHITVRTIAGAVSIYLQIGLAFALIYHTLHQVAPGSIAINSSNSGLTFVYLSFITLTTVGFGDILPVSDAARVATMFEAVIGQIYLVVIVARLVSLYGQDLSMSTSERAQLAADVQEGLVDEEVLPMR